MGFDPASMMFIGAAALSATSSVFGGIAENNAAKLEAKQYEQNAKIAKIGADQAEVLRREDLLSTLSSIRAIRGARGLDPTSPTALAINRDRTKSAERAAGAERLNALNTAQAYRTQGALTRFRGKTSMIGGFLKAGTTLLQAGSNINWGGGK
jgi:hypothetical protein